MLPFVGKATMLKDRARLSGKKVNYDLKWLKFKNTTAYFRKIEIYQNI